MSVQHFTYKGHDIEANVERQNYTIRLNGELLVKDDGPAPLSGPLSTQQLYDWACNVIDGLN
jgi:hypothetical protein